MEAGCLKLTGHDGQPHYVPLAWVERVDQRVYLNRDVVELAAEWSSTPVADKV